jgi:hypothetical protein
VHLAELSGKLLQVCQTPGSQVAVKINCKTKRSELRTRCKAFLQQLAERHKILSLLKTIII